MEGVVGVDLPARRCGRVAWDVEHGCLSERGVYSDDVDCVAQPRIGIGARVVAECEEEERAIGETGVIARVGRAHARDLEPDCALRLGLAECEPRGHDPTRQEEGRERNDQE